MSNVKRFIDTTESSISKYLKDVRKLSLITADQEIVLAKRIAKGDELAKEELCLANLRFVISVAKDAAIIAPIELPPNMSNYSRMLIPICSSILRYVIVANPLLPPPCSDKQYLISLVS